MCHEKMGFDQMRLHATGYLIIMKSIENDHHNLPIVYGYGRNTDR